MPDPEQPSTSEGTGRISQLKPPGKLDFEISSALPQAWKRWKEEVTLYMDLAMNGREEQTKVKLLLYIIGNQGREIYETLPFERVPSERTLEDVIDAFEQHCNPKKNETVERYKFFTRVQEATEPLEKFIVDLKILASTCSFGTLKDSLIRDRIICGIHDSKLREELLKVADLDLDKCLKACRISELSKERNKAIEATTDTVHNVNNSKKKGHGDKDEKNPNRKWVRKCKFCGRKHERGNCPAYGTECHKCHRRNHFASVCMSRSQEAKIHTVQTESESDSDYDEIKTIDFEPDDEINAVMATEFPKRLFATVHVGETPVRFQLDSGASCNVISAKTLEKCIGKVVLRSTTRMLAMHNKTTVQPLGLCQVELRNSKNGKWYEAKFTVLKEECTPLLGSETIQQMNLIQVRFENILSLETETGKIPLSKDSLLSKYPDVFEGTGKFEGSYHLEIEPDSTPVVHSPRKVPVAIKAQLKEELERLHSLGIIVPVTEPTPWVSSMVVVRKPNGNLRICIDPKDLNKVLKRSHYPLPTIEDILPDLRHAKVFSTFDVKNGFWHIALDEESSKLTSFNTPFGRYRWLRLPFGLSSAPEEFQRRQHQIVEGLPGVLSIHDDILLFGEGETYEEAHRDHDEKLEKLMKRCQERNVKLNKEKLKLRLSEVPYIGHVLTDKGLKPDPNKIKAMLEMPKPTDVPGIQRLIGFVNYLSKFLPRLSEVCEPLRKLMAKEVEWHWTEHQEQAFEKIRQLVTEAPVLRYYEPKEELTLQSDASQTGLGAVLTQNGQPLAFASRALSDAETRYAQIEKELLSVVFGLERFHQYTYGRRITVQTDHKPLESIVKKPLHMAPKRLQRLLLRLLVYDVDLGYRSGRQMELADTLSRAYLPHNEPTRFEEDVQTINMVQDLPLAAARRDDIRAHTANDEGLQVLIKVIMSGWPEQKDEVPVEATPYFHIRDELSVQNGIILRGERAVIPKSLRRDMIPRIHAAHIGIEGCLRRARECLYWPAMNSEVKDFIQQCDVCRSSDNKQQKETLHPHDVPDRPWAKVAVDLFKCNKTDYLIIVDYFSGFWEVDPLESTTASHVIRKMKMQFARHGIPDVCVSDNGPQFIAEEYKQFSKKWKFEFTTTSPRYPRSNGKVENAVGAAQRLMSKAKKEGSDAYLALLDYRNTPTQGLDTSPVQRLMSRRTKTLLPTTANLLGPRVIKDQHHKLQLNKVRQAKYYNKGARDLPELKEGDVVRMNLTPDSFKQEDLLKAKVKAQVGVRSYEVQTESGRKFRRNRIHLRKSNETFKPSASPKIQLAEHPKTAAPSTPQEAVADTYTMPVTPTPPSSNEQPSSNAQGPPPVVTQDTTRRTRYGREVRRPKHLQEYT